MNNNKHTRILAGVLTALAMACTVFGLMAKSA